MTQSSPEFAICPKCGAQIETTRGFTTWCDACEWNLRPMEPETTNNIFRRYYLKLGIERSQSLFRELSNQLQQKPKRRGSTIAAFALSFIVHSITVVLIWLTVFLLVNFGIHLYTVAGAGICLVLVLMLFPRPLRLPSNTLPRNQYPELYTFVDAVASSLGAKPIDHIVVNEDFNAWISRAGWRQRSVLCLGLPLWTILNDQERTALLGHELSHSVNGDVARSVFIGAAIDTLGRWYRVLLPTAIWERTPPGLGNHGMYIVLANIMKIPLNIILFGLAYLVRYIAHFLCLLLWQDSQQAEYYADYLATSVSGSNPMLSMLFKLHFGEMYEYTVQQVSVRSSEKLDFFEEFLKNIRSIPLREVRRIERIERLTHSRIDSTHPPTGYRIEMINTHPIPTPHNNLPDLASSADSELRALRANIQRRIQDKYLSHVHSLYG